MKKWMTILGGLLIVQIAVAVALNVNREDYRAFEPEEPLLSFDADAIDRIQIDGDAVKRVVLNKQDSQWRLPELKAFPADQGSVKRLLDRLSKLEKGWPVATTAGAAKRFKVDETAFERKLTLLQGEKTQAMLYVGTSPGFRKVHVRLPDEDDVHAVVFSTYDVGLEPEDWIDKAILAHPAKTIRRLELPHVTLHQQDDQLEITGLAEDEETVRDEAKRLLDRIAGLNIRNVLVMDDTSDDHAGETELRYTLELESGDKQSYVFSKPKDAQHHYVLKASHREEYFEVDSWAVDRIKEVTRDKLIRKKPTTPGSAEETSKETPQPSQ